MARAAVRAHRDTHVHELDRHTHRLVPGRRLVLDGPEGPSGLTFLDDRRLLGNHGHEFEVHDCVTGQRLISESSVGSCCAVAARRGRLSGVAIHALPSLVMVGMVVADDSKAQARPARSYEGGPHVAALAVSPSERWLASGDWLNTVRLWSVPDLTESGTPREPRAVQARIVGKHLGWISAVAFVDEARLLSAGWDGAVLEWPTVEVAEDEEEPVCVRAAHSDFVTSLAISGDRKRALSSANDGKVIVWDLERGASPRPLFSIPYGNHSLPVVLRVSTEDVRVAVGTREAVFDHRGMLLEVRDCELPEESKRSLSRFVRVESPTIEAVDVCVEAFDRPEEEYACKGDAPSLVFFDESPTGAVEVLDLVALEAPALTFAWVDARTLLVLDAGGHVTFWNWK